MVHDQVYHIELIPAADSCGFLFSGDAPGAS